jgi:hypothetical protein
MADWAPAGRIPRLAYATPTLDAGVRAHRGGAILALGIVGIVVCFILGIIAWVMGTADLRAMDAGTMDPSGRGLTQAGRICGIIGTVLGLGGLLLAVIMLLIGVTAGIAAA